jgi:anti-sigma factor RsiW
MICRDARELLSALIDEQLTDAEEIAIRSHLESCAGCRAALGEMEGAVAAVRSLPRVDVSDDFTARVMGRVERFEARRFRWPRWERWDLSVWLPAPALRVAAALVLGVLVGYGGARFWTGRAGAPMHAQEELAAPAESSAASALSSPVEPGLQRAIPAGDEIDYVLDRYTMITGRGATALPGASNPSGPAVANQDVPVRF